MKMDRKRVPIEIRRLVANHLESVRETEIGCNVKDAHIGNDVCPIYRPDLKDVAYYQFEVKSADESSIGFILVSAGEHDFPIPHWSMESPPISTILEDDAKKHGKKAGKIYKVDALAYILEEDTGEEAARLGSMPGLIKNIPSNLSGYVGNISLSESVIDGAFETDEKPEKIKHKITKKESKNPKHEIQNVKSWGEFRSQFAKTFKPHLDMLKESARKTWDAEKLIRKYGEGIFSGKPFLVPFLESEYSYDIHGEAAKHVKVNILKRPNCMDVAELICEDPKLGREANFTLKIKYANNELEKLDFFIVTEDTPSNEKEKIGLKEEV